jgi:putative salt-induced outer membrane protein
MKNLLMVVLFVAAGAGPAGLLEAQETSKKPPLLSGEGSVSYVQTSGNSDSKTFGAGLDAVYQPAPWKAELKASFVTNQADGKETARRLTASLRADRNLSLRFALYAQGAYLRDRFAGIEGQEIVQSGGQYAILPGPVHTLSASVGLAYTKEQRIEAADRSFLGASAGISYHWALAPTSVFEEDIGYLPDFEDSSDWRMNAATSLTTSINSVLAVKLSHELAYVHSPVPGKRRTDSTFLASIVAKWPGKE